MLVLTRRIGQEIVIAGAIRVSVVNVHGGRVRLGVVAPPAVTIVRKEVDDRRKSQSTLVRSGPTG